MKCCAEAARPSVGVKVTVPSVALVLAGAGACAPTGAASVMVGLGVSTGVPWRSWSCSLTDSCWLGSACSPGAAVTTISWYPGGVHAPARQMLLPPQPVPSVTLPFVAQAGVPEPQKVEYF